MKRLLIFLGLLLVSPAILAHASPAVIQKAMSSVVFIEVPRYEIQRTFDSENNTVTESKRVLAPILGTGFVINGDEVVTNYHVVAYSIEHGTHPIVRFRKGNERYSATIEGYDEIQDIALLKIKGEHPSVHFAKNTSKLLPGEDVFTISNFFSFSFSVTFGEVSSNNRLDPDYPYIHLLQVQIAEGNGSSGGPIFNDQGEVVAVNHTVLELSPLLDGAESMSNIAFGLRGDQVSKAIDLMRRVGKITHCDFGAWLESYGPRSDFYLNTSVPGTSGRTGIAFEGYYMGNAGQFKKGDVIISVNGHHFFKVSELLGWLSRAKRPGQVVDVLVFRNGHEVNIRATVMESHMLGL